MLKVAFVSCFFSHHQLSFSDAMVAMEGMEYYFIETTPMSEERKKLGWGLNKPKYVLPAYESAETERRCQKIINEADFVIIGSADDKYLEQRHREKKLVFRYSERFYKNGCPAWQVPLRFLKNYYRFNRHKNDYLLCASAYTSSDAAVTKSFVGKSYRWGYFTALSEQNADSLIAGKQENGKVSLLWAGRFLPLKHPEAAVLLAEQLKQQKLPFSLTIIGSGEMENELRGMIENKDLSDCVTMTGSMQAGQVRGYMERSDIFLFTSDFHEGWGAVLNESMNSACAVVASHAIGSAPFLINDRENGFIYKNGDIEQLTDIVVKLIKDQALRTRLGRNAYQTISEEWNGSVAAERLIALYGDIKKCGKSSRFTHGPCSPAPIIRNEWYRND